MDPVFTLSLVFYSIAGGTLFIAALFMLDVIWPAESVVVAGTNNSTTNDVATDPVPVFWTDGTNNTCYTRDSA